MSEARFDSILARLDALPAQIRRARLVSFWMGWASGTIGWLLGGWLF